MSIIKKFELFDTTSYYRWFKDEESNYRFEDDLGTKFLVEFHKIGDVSEMFWYYFDTTTQSWSLEVIKTNIYRLLPTVLGEILKDYIFDNPDVMTILIRGKHEKFEKSPVSKRTRIFHAWLQKNPIQDFDLSLVENEIYLEKIL